MGFHAVADGVFEHRAPMTVNCKPVQQRCRPSSDPLQYWMALWPLHAYTVIKMILQGTKLTLPSLEPLIDNTIAALPREQVRRCTQ